jgi:hypothetical protein
MAWQVRFVAGCVALIGLAGCMHPLHYPGTPCHHAGDRLLTQTAIGFAGSLVAHLSRHTANALGARAGQQVPGLSRLAVHLQGSGFLLTGPPSFHLMRQLTSLRYCGNCSTCICMEGTAHAGCA